MSLPVLQVRRHGVIGGQDGDVRACVSVGPAGEVVSVWTTAEDLEAVTSRTVSAGGASFPDPGATRPVAARITVHVPDRLALTELGADRAQLAGEYRIVLPDGEPLPSGTRVIGRGSRLHFLTDTSWYQLEMDDIPVTG